MNWKIDLNLGFVCEENASKSILFNMHEKAIYKTLGIPNSPKMSSDKDSWYGGVAFDQNLQTRISFDKDHLVKRIEILCNIKGEVDIFGIKTIMDDINSQEKWSELIRKIADTGTVLTRNETRSPAGYVNDDSTIYLGYDDDMKFSYISLSRPKKQILEYHLLDPQNSITLAGDGIQLYFGQNRGAVRELLKYDKEYCLGPSSNVDLYQRQFPDSKFEYYTIVVFFKEDLMTKVQIGNGVDLRFSNKNYVLNTSKEIYFSRIEDGLTNAGFNFIKREFTTNERDDYTGYNYIDVIYLDEGNSTSLKTARINSDKIIGVAVASESKELLEDIKALIPKLDYTNSKISGWY